MFRNLSLLLFIEERMLWLHYSSQAKCTIRSHSWDLSVNDVMYSCTLYRDVYIIIIIDIYIYINRERKEREGVNVLRV